MQATVIRPQPGDSAEGTEGDEGQEGRDRVTGEEWLVKKVGAHLPGVYEEVVDIVNAYVLTDKNALHLRAVQTFRDVKDRVRKTGEEWLITMNDSEAYIPNVNEEVIGVINITTLSSRQYCVILNPWGPMANHSSDRRRWRRVKSPSFSNRERSWKTNSGCLCLVGGAGLVLKATEAFIDKDEVSVPFCLPVYSL
ncbi:major vault protein-like [Heterodontus francisci]|uniref:major vault protein-like n=1 Tax=Heterodontus francisci TaxID=7792 RepID=UPI00355C112A